MKFQLILLIWCFSISSNQAFTSTFRLPFSSFSTGETIKLTEIDGYGTNDTIILNSTDFSTLNISSNQTSNLIEKNITDLFSLNSSNNDTIKEDNPLDKIIGLLPLDILSSNDGYSKDSDFLNDDLINANHSIHGNNRNDEPLFIIPLMSETSNLTVDDKISVNNSNPKDPLIPLWLSDINSVKEINSTQNIVYIDPLSLAEQFSDIYINSTELNE